MTVQKTSGIFNLQIDCSVCQKNIYKNGGVVVMEFRHLENVSGCEQNIPKVLHDRVTITSLDFFFYVCHPHCVYKD
jgi:hypothetical protein